MSITCSKCGNEFPDTEEVCPNCGQPAETQKPRTTEKSIKIPWREYILQVEKNKNRMNRPREMLKDFRFCFGGMGILGFAWSWYSVVRYDFQHIYRHPISVFITFIGLAGFLLIHSILKFREK